MLAKVNSGAVYGVDGFLVEVEVDVGGGLPAVMVVGLADSAVQESKDRVRAAVKNSGYSFPVGRVTINLAPADVRKIGPLYDLPIALGVLAASDQITSTYLPDYLVLGELSLDGSVRPISGALPIALEAKRHGFKGIILPAANAKEAALVGGFRAYGVSGLQQVIDFLKDPNVLLPESVDHHALFADTSTQAPDMSEVKGQLAARRALEISASGAHNLLLVGSPGSGKTMLARRLPGILPPLNLAESLDVTRVYSISGLLPNDCPLITRRPFRSPHHSVSPAGLVGGSSIPKPGEVTLAHHGVLFLDEFSEFSRSVLEVLRQPLEDRTVTISRARLSLTYPADFTLVAASNPCPCGFKGDPVKDCTCAPQQADRYWSRLSGPLLDRIDLQIEVRRLCEDELMNDQPAESSAVIRQRVLVARERQASRFRGATAVYANAQMRPAQLREYCRLDGPSEELMRRAIAALGLSARSFDRILKVARTIADLAGADAIQATHVAEAIQYRMLDRGKG